jgi:hypothetical protein
VSPSIPFATSIETPAPLQDALRAALRNVARSGEWAQARSGLMLQDIVPVEPASYGVQLQYEREAHASGYAELKGAKGSRARLLVIPAAAHEIVSTAARSGP